jgi:hypothetical protein
LNLIQSKNVTTHIDISQQVNTIPRTTRDEIARPDYKIHPVSLISLELRWIHDGADLGGSNNLGVVRQGEKIVVGRGNGLEDKSVNAVSEEKSNNGWLTPWSP